MDKMLQPVKVLDGIGADVDDTDIGVVVEAGERSELVVGDVEFF